MHTLTELKMVDSWDADADLLSTSIKKLRGPLQILEAGCGRRWPIDLKGMKYQLTGIDLDSEALKSRVREIGDLDEAIVGDLCTPGMIRPDYYDVIYSSFVLEHIREPEPLLRNMIAGLKPGGILLLRIPDRDSVYGWTARTTPFFVHVAYYKLMLGQKNAGKPGFAPYPTFHAPIVSRGGIWEFCSSNGCEVVQELGHTYYLRGNSLRSRATKLYARILSALSFGSLDWRYNNLTYVIRKVATAPMRQATSIGSRA